MVLKEYGGSLYAEGRSLFVYRHLVVHTQQSFVGTKPHLQCCWDLIARWEIAEPPSHRVPVPERSPWQRPLCHVPFSGCGIDLQPSLASHSLEFHVLVNLSETLGNISSYPGICCRRISRRLICGLRILRVEDEVLEKCSILALKCLCLWNILTASTKMTNDMSRSLDVLPVRFEDVGMHWYLHFWYLLPRS